MDPSRRHQPPQQSGPSSSGNPQNNRPPQSNHGMSHMGHPGTPAEAAARLAAASSATNQSRASASNAAQHFSQGSPAPGPSMNQPMQMSTISQRLQGVPKQNTTSTHFANTNAAAAALHHAYGTAQAQWGVPNPLAMPSQQRQSTQPQATYGNPAPMHAAPAPPAPMQPRPVPQPSQQQQQQQYKQQQHQQPQQVPQQQVQHHAPHKSYHHPQQQGHQPQSFQQQQVYQQQPQQAVQQHQQQYRGQQQPQQQYQHQQVAQQQQPQPARSVQVQQNQQGGQVRKKVILSPEAKQALAKAIWSAIRSPTGTVSPDLMQAALRTGLPRHAILNAARVARDREAMKRRQAQQPAPMSATPGTARPTVVMNTSPAPAKPPAASNSNHNHNHNISVTSKPMSSHYPNKPMSHHPVAQHPSQQMKPAASSTRSNPQIHPTPSTPPPVKQPPPPSKQPPPVERAVKSPPKPAPPVPAPAPANNDAKLKQIERSQWRRVQHGIFTIQKDKFVALPFSVGCMSRTKSTRAILPVESSKPSEEKAGAGMIRSEALMIQQQLRANLNKKVQQPGLLDPENHKRIKVEPKKFGRGFDRFARKARQTAAEGLLKQQKEIHKLLASHQTEFFKFHRARKAETAKLCKTIRDSFEKEEKKKEKDHAQAEKARLAALRANDMTAYSQLLEETKNERLKYLLDKTEKHFTQISTLLQQRSDEGCPASNSSNTAGAGTTSYYASAHVHNEEVRQPSILIGGDLKEYQLTGLQWMVSLYNNRLNGILADEMGLGKTIQAISLIAYLMEFKQNLGPYLVIVPLSTLSNWSSEFTKWLPAARVVCYKGTPIQRRDIYKDQVRAGHFNVLLTTYEYIIRDKKFLRKTDWQYAIVDEGHRMKNSQSKFAVTLATQYNTSYRILLTGTPLMNDLSELWSLLNFLLPNIFNSAESFDQWFSRPFSQFGESKSEEGADDFLSNEERILIIHRLHELLRPFMLRRVKSEVLDQLPEKVEKVLRCELSSWQKELYKQISVKAVEDPTIMAQQGPSRGLNNIVMQLRKVCNHPYLFTPEGYHMDDNIVRSSGKMALLDQMLPKLKRAGHRVLMFTQMTAVMTIMEDYFAMRGFLSLRLDGSTPAEEREKRMFKFNAPDSPYFVFLLSTRAGGLGLNLTSANTVIIFDSDWNPAMDLQAQDRAHRIGQKSDVSVFRLITNSPVEEKILSRATEKKNVSELVVESGKFNKDSVDTDNSMERKKLMEVLLTDFDGARPSDKDKEKSYEENGEDDDDEGSAGSEKEDLNELLSNNEVDYQLYAAMDEELESEGGIRAPLFTDDADVPGWIRHPPEAGSTMAAFNTPGMVEGNRKRKNVMYDDGLTEKQFLRMMEKQAVEEEKSLRKKPRVSKSPAAAASASSPAEDDEDDEEAQSNVNSGLTDWTFRKLISCSKSVVALKDPSTKRRLSDIFIEKPDPSQFPDYYEIIDKPIAINDILRKCRAKLYVDLQEFKADWSLMFANARKFNGDDSWVVDDANALQKELERVLKKNGFSDDSVPISKKKKLRIQVSLKKGD